MFNTLDENEIEVLLTNQLIGRIGILFNNHSYILPVRFAYDGVFIYILTDIGSTLYLLRNSSRICFEVDDSQDAIRWKRVVCWGFVEELTDDKDKRMALNKLSTKLPINVNVTCEQNQWPFPKDSTQPYEGLFFRIRIHRKTGCSNA